MMNRTAVAEPTRKERLCGPLAWSRSRKRVVVCPSAVYPGLDAVRERGLGEIAGLMEIPEVMMTSSRSGGLPEAGLDPFPVARLRDTGAPPGVVERVEGQVLAVSLE